jgi:hypothetical protein
MGKWLLLALAILVLLGGPLGRGLHPAADWLAAQPQLGDTFAHVDPDTRQDALSLLFLFVFGAPPALLVALGLLTVLLGVLVEIMRPAARALALPDGAARAAVVLAVVVVVWVTHHAWIARSLWALGILARAYRTVVS